MSLTNGYTFTGEVLKNNAKSDGKDYNEVLFKVSHSGGAPLEDLQITFGVGSNTAKTDAPGVTPPNNPTLVTDSKGTARVKIYNTVAETFGSIGIFLEPNNTLEPIILKQSFI